MDEAVKLGQLVATTVLCLTVAARGCRWLWEDWSEIRGLALAPLVMAVVLLLGSSGVASVFYAAAIQYPSLRQMVSVRVLLGLAPAVAALLVMAAKWRARDLDVMPRLIRCTAAFLALWVAAAWVAG